jgi:hypothetical protein
VHLPHGFQCPLKARRSFIPAVRFALPMTDGQKQHEEAEKEAETLKRVRGLSHVGRYGNTGHEHTDIEQPALPGLRPPISPPVGSGRIPIARLIGHALPAGQEGGDE